MPAFITHYLYGTDVYHNVIPSYIKTIIKEHTGSYNLGLQGPDIFYYHIPSSLRPSEYNIGNQMHETKISTFFQNYMNWLTSYCDEKFYVGLSYLCGMLCHYTLDSKVHPYIYYRSGYDPSIKGSNRDSFPMHSLLESTIDKILLYEKRRLQPSQFYPPKTIYLKPIELTVVTKLLSDCINQTYFRDPTVRNRHPLTSPSRIRNIILSVKLESLFLHDSTGKRRRIVSYLSRYMKSASILSSLMVTDDLEDEFDSCNLTHANWFNPWDKKLSSNDSFFNLYEKSLKHYQDIIEELYRYILRTKMIREPDRIPFTFGKETVNPLSPLLCKIQNLSYHSGLDME
ncbi:MAG TPA: zinc dependent phospholipase C family protein [Lachnospiraceae bacterium]|nr:zinc dependent phospholipase C family protein [Lachnospiraceae bacterium]